MIDLHTHSTESDGSLSPKELISQAAAAGIKTIALTDHDCTAGLDAARAQAEVEGIQLINGIELSVTWFSHTLHIVGLAIDPQTTELKQLETEALAFRQWRAEQISARLAKVNIDGALEGAQRYASSKLISRSHFAQFLVEQGYAKNFKQVFKRYMVPGKPGYVAGEWPSMKQGVETIINAGGVAVIAHPARYKLSRTKLRRLLRDFTEAGGEAIEVVSGSHGPHEVTSMAAHANDFGLAASVGSDYHGPDKQWIRLGKLAALPHSATPVWTLPPLAVLIQA